MLRILGFSALRILREEERRREKCYFSVVGKALEVYKVKETAGDHSGQPLFTPWQGSLKAALSKKSPGGEPAPASVVSTQTTLPLSIRVHSSKAKFGSICFLYCEPIIEILRSECLTGRIGNHC